MPYRVMLRTGYTVIYNDDQVYR